MDVDGADDVAIVAVGEGLVQSSHVEMMTAAGIAGVDEWAGHVCLRLARIFAT